MGDGRAMSRWQIKSFYLYFNRLPEASFRLFCCAKNDKPFGLRHWLEGGEVGVAGQHGTVETS